VPLQTATLSNVALENPCADMVKLKHEKVKQPQSSYMLFAFGGRSLVLWDAHRIKSYSIPRIPTIELYQRVVDDWQEEYPSIKSALSGAFNIEVSTLVEEIDGMHVKVKPGCHCYDEEFHEGYTLDLSAHIQHLNDHDKWTTNQIADWLETLDQQPVLGLK
jgi:hypothetical protein